SLAPPPSLLTFQINAMALVWACKVTPWHKFAGRYRRARYQMSYMLNFWQKWTGVHFCWTKSGPCSFIAGWPSGVCCHVAMPCFDMHSDAQDTRSADAMQYDL